GAVDPSTGKPGGWLRRGDHARLELVDRDLVGGDDGADGEGVQARLEDARDQPVAFVAVVPRCAVRAPGVVAVDQVVDLRYLTLRRVDLGIRDPVAPEWQYGLAVERRGNREAGVGAARECGCVRQERC